MSTQDQTEQLQRAISALRQAKLRIQELERARNEPVAIIGMSGRFPGGEELDAFWAMLRDGRSALTEVPLERWDLDAFYDPDPRAPGKMYLRTGGFLEDLFGFDPAFFNLSEAEVEAIDPQQRLLLEVGWEALERAGVEGLEESATGVFVGISTYDYGGSTIREETIDRIAPYTVTGVAHANAAGRLSYLLGLRGPSLTVDTACSSGLVAVHQACRALQAGDCDLALAAGTNAVLLPWFTIAFCRLGVLSLSGRSRPFDAGADGYVRSEGCGAVVLKRLADAERDGDPILAVIRGSAVNHNGTGNGIIAPSSQAQLEVIREAMRRAGITPAQLDYLEAFGSSLSIGDTVELSALETLARERPAGSPLPIGSVKGNIGHTEAASGLAGLVKLLLCLERRTLAPHAPIERRNPVLADPESRLELLSAPRPWPADAPRRAGISALGFSGTNAHLVIEGPVACGETGGAETAQLLLLAARDAEALELRARRLAEHLEAHPEIDLATLCRSAARAPRIYPHRAALVCTDRESTLQALRAQRWTARGDLPIEPARTLPAPLAEAWKTTPGAVDPGLLAQLAKAFVAGIPARWDRLAGPGRRVALPPHPFRHRLLRAETSRPATGTRAASQARERLPEAPIVAGPSSPVPSRGAGPDRAEVIAWLRARLGEVARNAPDDLRTDRSLLELGVDSMAALHLLQRVQQEFGIQLYPEELLGAPDLSTVADRVVEAARLRQAKTPAGEALVQARAAVDRHLERLFAERTLPLPKAPLPGPVFILSAPRTGSTLLRVMLAGHPDLFAPPELHLLSSWNLGEWLRTLAPNMLHAGLVQALTATGDSPDEARARVARWADEAAPIESAYGLLLERTAGRLLIDKSTSYALDRSALIRAERMFEAPRYLLLTRHPAAMIESFVRMRMSRLFGAEALDPWLVGEEVWRRTYEQLEALRQGLPPERTLTVSFEALAGRPEETMRQVTGFLGVPFHPALLEPYTGERMVPDLEGAISFVGDPGFSRRGRLEPELGERGPELILPHPWSPTTRDIARRWGYDLDDRREARARILQKRLEEDARLPGPLPRPSPAREGHPHGSASPSGRGCVLLTGATGFLGAWLLDRLIARTDARILCLVRAPSAEAGLERLRQGLKAQGLEASALDARVEVLPGDLALPQLGLDQPAWESLARRIDAIYHNGAVVHFTWPYESLYAANVRGTWEVLRLAAEAGHRPVHHISSRGVLSADAYVGERSILEDAPPRPLTGFSSGYQQSKWVAEMRVRAAMAAGLPATIHRPGRIAGSVDDGRLPDDDLLCRFLLGCHRLGALPEVDLSLEMVPVDRTADAVVALSLDPGALGHAFHLVHTTPLELAHVQQVLVSLGLPLEVVDYARWRTRLREDPGNPLEPLLPLLGETFPLRPDESRFATDNVSAHHPGWVLPPVEAQLERLVHWLRHTGRLVTR